MDKLEWVDKKPDQQATTNTGPSTGQPIMDWFKNNEESAKKFYNEGQKSLQDMSALAQSLKEGTAAETSMDKAARENMDRLRREGSGL